MLQNLLQVANLTDLAHFSNNPSTTHTQRNLLVYILTTPSTETQVHTGKRLFCLFTVSKSGAAEQAEQNKLWFYRFIIKQTIHISLTLHASSEAQSSDVS